MNIVVCKVFECPYITKNGFCNNPVIGITQNGNCNHIFKENGQINSHWKDPIEITEEEKLNYTE